MDATVIGGLAVGAYAAELGSPALSADLDLLMTREHRERIVEAATNEPRLEVIKRPQARNLPVLVMRWEGLEIDVLTQSAGLPEPALAFARSWAIEGVHVADPLDLLSNKLAVHRDKDVEHIEILRSISEGFCLFFLESRPGRQAVEYLQRGRTSKGGGRYQTTCLPSSGAAPRIRAERRGGSSFPEPHRVRTRARS